MIALWGANGFIGRHLTHLLCARDTLLTLFARDYAGFPFALPSSVLPVTADFAQPSSYIGQLWDCSVMVLMVTASGVGTFAHAPEQEILHNVTPYRNFFQSLRDNKIKPAHIIYLSSGGAVYGVTGREPVPETHHLNPISPYGVGKVAIEESLMDYCAGSGAAYTILRVANVVGAWAKPYSLIPGALKALRTGEPLTVRGDGNMVRDYFDVRELAQAIDLVIKTPQARDKIFNVGSGQGYSIHQVLGIIEGLYGKPVPVRYVAAPDNEIPYSVLDCRSLYKCTEWKAAKPLEACIAEMAG